MTIDEMIHIFENSRLVSEHFEADAVTAVYVEALSALRAQEDAEANEPLTLEELQQMDGQPVWLNDAPNGWRCFIVNLEYSNMPCGVDAWGRATSLSLLVECGLYRRPPKENPRTEIEIEEVGNED